MGQVRGVTRRQLLERHYKEAVHDLNIYMEAHNQNIQALIDNYNNKNELGRSWFFTVASIPFGLARGLIHGSIDLLSTARAIKTQLIIDTRYLFDSDDSGEVGRNLRYMLNNLGATAVEGISGALFGAAADFGHFVWGADTSWADDPVSGVIANFSRLGNQMRANALTGAPLFEGFNDVNAGFWTGMNERFFGDSPDETYDRLEQRDARNKAIIEGRWQTEAPRGIGEGTPPPLSLPEHSNAMDEFLEEYRNQNFRDYDSVYSPEYSNYFKEKYGRPLPPFSAIPQEQQENGWTQEQLDEDAKRYAQEQFNYEMFQDLLKDLERHQGWKENVSKWTGEDFFYERAGGNPLYQHVNTVSFSLGRLIPAFIMTKFAGGTGLSSKVMKTSSRAWFAGSVAGGAMEEALLKGASPEDAFSFALGSSANELFWAQVGGIRLGDPASMAIQTKRKLIRTAMIEAAEEAMIEKGYRGLRYYSNPNNEIMTGESRNELWQRVFFAGSVGGLSGLTMGSISMARGMSTENQLKQFNQALVASVNNKGSERTTAEMQRVMKRFETRLNAEWVSDSAKDAIMNDPIVRQLFNESKVEVDSGRVDSQGVPIMETSKSYSLSDIGKKIEARQVLSTQKGQNITKQAHAVSQENFFLEHRSTVPIVNQDTGRVNQKQIEIVTRERARNSANGELILELLDSGLNIAVVEVSGRNVQATPDGFNSFVDLDSGVMYVNLHSRAALEGVMTHELHDIMNNMARNGMMTKQGRESYMKFLTEYMSETNSQFLQDVGVQFNEAAYAQAYQGRPDAADLIRGERVSAFLQQAMNNPRILERALGKDRNVFQRIGDMFTRKAYYNKMLKEMGIDASKSPQMAKTLAKLEKSYTQALRANMQAIKGVENFHRHLFGQPAANTMFSLDTTTQKETYKREVFADFFSENHGAHGIHGLDLQSFVQPQNIELFLTNQVGSNKHTTFQVVTPETHPLRYKEGYIFVINDNVYFNKNALEVHPSMFISNVSFNADTHAFKVELLSKTNPNTPPIERYITNNVEVNGRLIENASMFETSVSIKALEYFLEKGKLPAQSIAATSVAGNGFFTGGFGPVTIVLNKNIAQATSKNDFHMFRQDMGTARRHFHFGENYIDLVRGDNVVVSELSIGAKMKIFQQQLYELKQYVQREGVFNEMLDGALTNQTQADMNYEKMFQNLEALRFNPQNKNQTLQELKNEINFGRDLQARNLLEMYETALSSFTTLMTHEANVGIERFAQFLNEADQSLQKKKTPYIPNVDNAQWDFYRENRVHFDNINEFIQTIPYAINDILTTEGKVEVTGENALMFVLNTKSNAMGKTSLSRSEIAHLRDVLSKIQASIKAKTNQEVIFHEIADGARAGKSPLFTNEVFNQPIGENIVFSLDSNKKKSLDKNAKNKTQEETNTNQQQLFDPDNYSNPQDYAEAQQTITPQTQTQFATKITQQGTQTVAQNINRFDQAKRQASKVNKQNYQDFEIAFADNIIEGLQKRLKKPQTPLEKTAAAIYQSLEHVVKKQRTNRQFYNHMGSHVTKTVINELVALSDLIANDKNRANPNPTDMELEYIVRQVNKAFFQTLDYIDSEVTIDINKSAENPNGYAFTTAIYWYLRDLNLQQSWDTQSVQRFQDDGRGWSYRRLINAILNYNQQGGVRELHLALKDVSLATSVENVSNLTSGGPRTIENAKRQWSNNANNINAINEIIGYKGRVSSWLDAFTIGETFSHFNPNGWGMILNERLVEGTENKLKIERLYKEHFERNGFLKQNYRKIQALESSSSAVNVQNLGNVQVRMGQIIYLRNMLLREVIRNRAIDLRLLRGEKSNHFNMGHQVDIQGEGISLEKRTDKRTIGTVTNPVSLLNELQNIINKNVFAKTYNDKVMEFFNMMFPFVNERYKEINGINLQNDGQMIRERLDAADATTTQNMFDGLDGTFNLDTITNIYVPFILETGGYFKQHAININQGIIDMGVFDGMTQEVTDSNAIARVESITDVVINYSREVANYYALHRVMSDLNRVLNERLDGYEQTTTVKRLIPSEAIGFYEQLLNDMAGYRPRRSDKNMARTLAFFRKNFYRATLGANLRVIGSQVTTLFNLSNIYGSHFTEMFPKMMSNFFAQHTKANKKKLEYLEANNNVYWDRKRSATFEVGEATTQGIFANNAFNRATQTLMKGIKFTDSSINRALYLTLLDTINPQTGKKFTIDEASNEVRTAILRSQSSVLPMAKSPLLRTQNELFRVMLRFLGEPMKLITQSYNATKRLQYINKLKGKQQQITETFDNQVVVAQQKLNEIETKVKTLEARETSDAFNTLPEAEQKAIHKELNEARKEQETQREVVAERQDNRDAVVKQVQDSINSMPDAVKYAKKRYTAFLVATMYLTFLRSGFDLVRSKGGAKDKPEDQAFMEYLTNVIGRNFLDSLTGSFPFYRDAYQTLAYGFSSTEIAEFTAFTDMGRTFNTFFGALSNGNDIHWGRTIRNLATSTGRAFGVPVFQIERLFTTPTLYVNESLHYRYQNLVGRRTRDNVELKRAIERGDTQMIEAIVDNRIASRGITVSNPVSNELVRLYGQGQQVNMTGINRSFTVNGQTFEMSRSQRAEFGRIYNQADFILQKLLSSPQYRRLNDDMRRSIIQSVYTYYYNMAKQKISGIDIIPESNYFSNLNQAYRYFLGRTDALFNRQRSPQYREEQRKKALAT